MHGLEKGIHQLALFETNANTRKNAVTLLGGIIDDINAGIDVWKGFLESGSKSAEPGAYGGWAKFAIERKLFDIELEARKKASEATNGSSSLDEPLISQAYVKLSEGEDATAAAGHAIEAMETRISRLNALIEEIKTTKPKKASGGSAKSSAKAGSKSKTSKTKAKKAKKLAAKKSTKKKAANKKPAKKKAKGVKKKTTAKKAVQKKKTTKKKSTKKKAVKKKAASTKKKARKK